MIKHYLKTAYRNISRRKGQSIIGIIGLAMSIVSFTFCLFILDYLSVLNYKIPNYQQIVEIKSLSDNKRYQSYWKETIGDQLAQLDIQGIEKIGFMARDYSYNIAFFSIGNEPEEPYIVQGIKVSRDFPEIFSISLLSGRKENLFKTGNEIVISASAAKKIYGDSSPIGQTMSKGGIIYTIQGVIEDIPVPSSISPTTSIDYLICLPTDEFFRIEYNIYALIKDKKQIPAINKQLRDSGIQQEEYKPVIHNNKIRLIENGEVNPMALIILCISFLVLCTGIVNFLSINIGTFYNRTKELVLRKVIGSTTGSFFGLFFTELLILISITFLLAICLTEVILPIIVDQINFTSYTIYIPTGYLIGKQLLYFICILVFCSLVALLAILRLQTLSTMQGLKGSNYNRSKHLFRNTMLGVQFFVTILFVGLVAIFHMQSKRIESEIYSTFPMKEQQRSFIISLNPLGYYFDNKIITGDPENELIRQFENHPGVEEIICSQEFIAGRLYRHKTPNGEELVYKKYTGVNFAQFFHLPLLSGRPIMDEQEILIGKSFFEKINTDDFDGHINYNDKNYKIVGVVEDFKIEFGGQKEEYFIIKHEIQPFLCCIKAFPGCEKEVKTHLEKTIRQWIPDTLPITIETFNDHISLSKMAFRALRDAASVFAVICLSLTLLGIYTAITLDTEKRQKEVGIRKINGATIQNITLQFGKLYIYIFMISSCFTIPVFYMVCYFLNQSNITYNFKNPFFWFVLVTVILAIILSIISYRLYKISHTNPAEVIKTE